jgi:hypothetical protein
MDEQATRERIGVLLKELGEPEKGKYHIVREGGVHTKNVEIELDYQPASMALMLVAPDGDERLYDRYGYEVYGD